MTPPSPRTSLFHRSRALALTKPGLALAVLAVAGLATAAVTLSYTNTSTVTTSVAPAPVQFLAGSDAGPAALSDYVTAYSISTNKTFITATVKGIPEGTLAVGSFFQLRNVDDTARSVTLSTAQVTNAYVTAYTLQVYTANNTLASTLSMTSTSPSATFTLPAGATYTARLTLTLASGAGADNVALTNAVALAVS